MTRATWITRNLCQARFVLAWPHHFHPQTVRWARQIEERFS